MKMRKLACKECHEQIEVKFSEYFYNSDIECPHCHTNHVIDFDAQKSGLFFILGYVLYAGINVVTTYDFIIIDIVYWTLLTILCFRNIGLEKVNWKKIH